MQQDTRAVTVALKTSSVGHRIVGGRLDARSLDDRYVLPLRDVFLTQIRLAGLLHIALRNASARAIAR